MRLWLGLMALVVNVMFFSNGYAEQPLPIAQAFKWSIKFESSKKLAINFTIAPRYYLYTKKFSVSFTPPVADIINYPQGEFQYDKQRGRYEAYAGNIYLPINLPTLDSRMMTVNYQGCSSDGFCYPPQQLRLKIDPATANVVVLNGTKSVGIASLLKNQQQVADLFLQQHLVVILGIFFVIGLLLAFTPCVLPMVPILTTIILGQQQKNTSRALGLSISYVLGSAVTYAVAGAIAARLGQSLQVWLQRPSVIIVTSVIFLLLALSMLEFWQFNLLQKWQHFIHRLSRKQQQGGYLATMLMGGISTLVVSPCVTAPLVGVLIYISQSGNLILGATALFIMGLGMGLPLIIVAMSAEHWLPKTGAWMHTVKQLFGIIMLGMAIWMVSRIASAQVTLWLSTLLLIMSVVLLYRNIPQKLFKMRHTRKVIYSLGVLLTLLVVALFATSPLYRKPVAISQQMATKDFVVVKSIAALNAQLAEAKHQHRPAVVDFYADWCESCLEMEKEVFEQPQAQQALQKFLLIRADLSENTSSQEALMQAYKVIAPPTVLFFTPAGVWLDKKTIVGNTDLTTFLQHVRQIDDSLTKGN